MWGFHWHSNRTKKNVGIAIVANRCNLGFGVFNDQMASKYMHAMIYLSKAVYPDIYIQNHTKVIEIHWMVTNKANLAQSGLDNQQTCVLAMGHRSDTGPAEPRGMF